jgi:chemotaxis protein MotB
MLPYTRRRSPVDDDTSGEPDGGYLASASDLMIGLLFVFIILVVVLALEQQRQAVAARAAIAKKSGDPRGDVTTSIGEKIRKQVKTVVVNPATGVLTLPEETLFASGSAVVSPSGIVELGKVARILDEVLPCYVAKPQKVCAENSGGHEIDTIFVEGHTDNRPLQRANGYDNTNLSFDRARAVYRLLAERADETRLQHLRNSNRQPLFSMSGYADSRLVADTDGADSKNRRVDLRIVLTYKKPVDELVSGMVSGKTN